MSSSPYFNRKLCLYKSVPVLYNLLKIIKTGVIYKCYN